MPDEEVANPWSPKFDFAALRAEDPNQAHYLDMIEWLCLNALDVRNRMICSLSAEDGVWSSGEIVKCAKRYRWLLRFAEEQAEVWFDHAEWLVFAMMDYLADKRGEAKILPW